MKSLMQMLRMALIGVGLVCGSALAADRSEQLTLGDSPTVRKGEVKGRDTARYAFTSPSDQPLTIRLAARNASTYFNVKRAGEVEALCQGAMAGNLCTVRPAASENLVVEVFLMRNAARRGEKAAYTLSIEQTAKP